ncbi:MAG: class I SAM-dependent methyltransferase [Acidobacteria bacterium]|nr:class I SAM-dependent methyltransferase [Acidobacteriota bacterium]
MQANRRIPLLARRRGTRIDIRLPEHVKAVLRSATEFIKFETKKARLTGNIPIGWRTLCALTNAGFFLYEPRSTCSDFYFGDSYWGLFTGFSGLDIGARVPVRGHRRQLSLSLGMSSMEHETFTPHWSRYQSLGAAMTAIDLLPDPSHPMVAEGDARLLEFVDGTFDFISVPRLLGPENTCCTALEIAACLSEMYRVLGRSGFVHLADPILQPSVCYAASLVGFAICYSKGLEQDVPAGTFLLKAPEIGSELFRRIPSLVALPSLLLMATGAEAVAHCNLVSDQKDLALSRAAPND